MITHLIIDPDGQVIDGDDSPFTPVMAQDLLGDEFEMYSGPDGTQIVARSTPTSTDKYNYFATRLARGLMPDDRIMGRAIIMGRPLMEGREEVPARVIEQLRTWVEHRS